MKKIKKPHIYCMFNPICNIFLGFEESSQKAKWGILSQCPICKKIIVEAHTLTKTEQVEEVDKNITA